MDDSKTVGLSRASQKRKKKLNSSKNAPDNPKISSNGHPSSSLSDAGGKMPKDTSTSKKRRLSSSFQVEDMKLVEIIEEEDSESNPATDKASKLLSLIVHPSSLQTFYDDYWDKRPMHNVKKQKIWLKGFISVKSITSLWETYLLKYNEDIRMTKYFNNTFYEINDSLSLHDDNIMAKDITAGLADGYCLTLLQPQRYHDRVWHLLSALEFEFNNVVSCHIHYFPGVCQGYNVAVAEHDTILIQLSSQTTAEVYDRASSVDLNSLPDHPYLSTIILHGDSLYIPSGHAFKLSNTIADVSICLSLHIMKSDAKSMIELLLPQALASAAANANAKLSQPLPRDYLSFMGVSASESDPTIEERRSSFHKILQDSLQEVVAESMDMSDAAADQLAKKFIAERLPLPMSLAEEQATSIGSPNAVISSYSHLRMLRPGIARAVVEDGMVVVYHCMDNARYLYGAPINPLEFEVDDGPAIEELLQAYPHSVLVEDIYHPSEELDDKISIAQALFKEGLLMIMDEASRPSQQVQDSDNDDDPF
jgi:bifunctional lysine-specific demethylase and histidyl-hydroxylase NO66